MSLIVALGSNIGNKIEHLNQACEHLKLLSPIIYKSRIYKSAAVDYEDQPDFYNQVIELEIPKIEPKIIMEKLLEIELFMGRVRDMDKGPRVIDLDILFWGLDHINITNLCVPHPRWELRSFVVRPLSELPFFKTLEKCFKMPISFDVDAIPLNS